MKVVSRKHGVLLHTKQQIMTQIDAQHTSDVAYDGNSIMSPKFTTPNYFTNVHCEDGPE